MRLVIDLMISIVILAVTLIAWSQLLTLIHPAKQEHVLAAVAKNPYFVDSLLGYLSGNVTRNELERIIDSIVKSAIGNKPYYIAINYTCINNVIEIGDKSLAGITDIMYIPARECVLIIYVQIG